MGQLTQPMRWVWPLALSLVVLLPPVAQAQPVDVPPTWGGDLSSRPRLTGSWGGLRDELGKKGVVLDVDVLGTPQGVVSGGRDTGVDIWGSSEYTLHVDTQKLGLWPGGFLKVYGMSSFGHSVNPRIGSIAGEHCHLGARDQRPYLLAHERDVHAVPQP